MKNGIISIKELEGLLNTEEYKYNAPEKLYIKTFETFNKWTTQDVFELFDTLIDQNGGMPPKPNEYIETGVEKTKAYWFKESPEGRLPKWEMVNGYWQATYLTWSEQIEQAVRWRLSRMYESMMAEYTAVCTVHTLYPTAILLTSSELDLCAGVDLVIVNKEQNKITYIHVTKNSQWTDENIRNKARKKIPLKNKSGKKIYWDRRLTNSHEVFKYDRFNSESTKYVNGHLVFREEYVQRLLEDKFKEEIDEVKGASELLDFHVFLKNNQIREDGITNMVITFQLSNNNNS